MSFTRFSKSLPLFTAVLAMTLSGCDFPVPSSASETSASSSIVSSLPVGPHTVTYEAGLGGSIQGECVQSVADGGATSAVTALADFRYAFQSWSDGVTLATRQETDVTQDMTLTATFVADGETAIPTMYVDTVGAITSDIDYTGASVHITSTVDDYNLDAVAAGIRLRGHSTQMFVKKPYRVKFDKKQSLFGHTAAKSWVLLADYLDPSSLHNYTALTLGRSLDRTAYQPMTEHIRLVLNGVYNGLYLLTEQPDEKPGRADVMTDITPEMSDYPFFICMDNWADSDPNEVLGTTYFNLQTDGHSQSFVIKYPEMEDFTTESQYYQFFDFVKDYMQDVVDAMASNDFNQMSAWIDTGSLTDYTLVDQIMNEPDHSFTSYYMARAVGGKVVFGPTWDYDLCLGYNAWLGYPNDQYSLDLVNTIRYNNFFASHYGATIQGQNALYHRWNETENDALSDYLLQFDDYVAFIHDELMNDAVRVAEMESNGWGNVYYSQQLVDDNIAYLKTWLIQRQQALNLYY